MKLSIDEYNTFIKLHTDLICFVGKIKGMISESVTSNDYLNFTPEERFPIKSLLYENIELIDQFLDLNGNDYTEDEKGIVKNFKHFKEEQFYVIKQTKKYAYFFGDQYVYGVHALSDNFETFWGKNLPVIVNAVLLPFKDKIVYDGILSQLPILIGKGIRFSLKNDSSLSEAKYGVIEQLPIQVKELGEVESAKRELITLMKTKSSREMFQYKVKDIVQLYPQLEPVYIKEWGLINSRNHKKELKALGVKKRWFAIYNNTIVVSGKSEKDIKKEVANIIEDEKMQEGILYFKV